MSAQFDDVLFKQRTREMVSFLNEKGFNVPLTLGYEAVARYIFGAKSWNNLASDFKKSFVSHGISLPDLEEPVLPAAVEHKSQEVTLVAGVVQGQQLQYKYRTVAGSTDHLVDVVIRASVANRPGMGHPQVDVSRAVDALPDDRLLDFAAKRWQDPGTVLELVDFMAAFSPLAAEVVQGLAHVPKDTLLGAVRRQDILPYVRAFRPHLLAKILLVERFGDLDSAFDAGFYVSKHPVRLGWNVTACSAPVYPQTGADNHFVAESDAWAALFYAMVARTDAFRFEDFFSVLDGSGYYEAIGRMGHEASRKIRSGSQPSQAAPVRNQSATAVSQSSTSAMATSAVKPVEVLSDGRQLVVPSALRLKCRRLLNGAEVDSDLNVHMWIASSDGQVKAEFPVTPAFHAEPGIHLSQYARGVSIGFVSEMARLRRADNEDVQAVLAYVESTAGVTLTGGVNRRDFFQYVQAFHPYRLSQMLLVEKFVSASKADRAGFEVVRVDYDRFRVKSAGKALSPDGSDQGTFPSWAEAYGALGKDMLTQPDTFDLSGLFEVVPGSGYEEQ